MPYMELCLQDRFYDPYFVYGDDDASTYYCDPNCYEWLVGLGKENELDRIQWMKVMLPLSIIAKKSVKPNYKPILYLTLINEFPLGENDTPYLVSIYNFFKEFESKRKMSDVERLERAIVCGSYPRIPESLMKRLVQFVCSDLENSPERLRLLLSEKIRPFLQTSSNKEKHVSASMEHKEKEGEKEMKYVKFYNEMTESFRDGFVVKEDENHFYVIDPICYEWLLTTGREAWLHNLSLVAYDHQFFSYKEIELPEKWSFMKGKKWLFNYPVSENDLGVIPMIANFFEWFIMHPNATLSDQLRSAKEHTKGFVPDDLANDICKFIIKHSKRL